jgi:hypothetical protein
MDTCEVFFRGGHGTPHISKIYAFECDGEKGTLEFDGYYYVNNGDNDADTEKRFSESLPKKETITVRIRLPIEPRVWRSEEPSFLKDANGTYPLMSCENTEIRADLYTYKILVERREKIYNTNEYSTIDDDCGGEMDVCFFPTDRQKIYFRVLETLQSDKNVPCKISRQTETIHINRE